MILRALLCLWLLAAATPAAAAPSITWRWSQKSTDIYAVSFSKDGRRVVFSRQYHWPMGREARELGGPAIQALQARRRAEPRFADPQVVLARVGQQWVKTIGYGWEPQMSPEGKRVVFVQQKQRVSGVPITPEALRGNSIAQYILANGRAVTLATPPMGFFTTPSVSRDGRQVAFLRGQALDGGSFANIELNAVDVAKRKPRTLLAPEHRDGQYRLLANPVWSRKQAVILAMTPGPATKEGPSYAFELVELGKKKRVLYAWGQRPAAFTPTYVFTPSDRLIVFDGQWLEITRPGAAARPIAGLPPAATGLVSRDGRWVLDFNQRGLFLAGRNVARHRVNVTLPGQIKGVSWAPDSRSAAVVVQRMRADNRRIFDRDELLLVRLR